MAPVFFWILALAALASALAVVLMRNPVDSVMALLGTMFAIAGLYVLLSAYLAALFQIIVYAGAVLVLFLFVVMLLNVKAPAPQRRPRFLLGALLAGAALLMAAGMACLAWFGPAASGQYAAGAVIKTPPAVRQIALDLFGRHILVFELTSVLLLVAAIGAVFISRKEASES